MSPSKVIIATDLPYTHEYEYLLKQLYSRKIEWLFTWGKHCEEWENAMDMYITDPERMDSEHHITTTSHAGESYEDVLNLATTAIAKSGINEVETIKL